MKRSVSLLRRLINTELIEIVVPAGTTKTKFQFPDQQNIRDAKLQGLQVFTRDMVPTSILSDEVVADFAFLSNIFVTLQAYNGENFVWQKPLITMINQEASGTMENYSPNAYTNQRVNWPKSYIELSSGIVIPPANSSILFEVNYIEKSAKQRKQNEARFKKQS